MGIVPLHRNNSAMHAMIFHSPACIVLSEILPKNVIGFPILDNWNVLYLIAMSSRKKTQKDMTERLTETDRERSNT